ncbi:MAG: ATP-grasp domain-containing protein [Pseudomonadota bacterium]
MLARSAGAPRIIPVDADPICSVRQHSADFVQVPPIEPPATYVEALLGICREAGARAVIPTNDLDLLVLARARDRFATHGVRVMGAPPEVVEVLGDKLEAASWLEQHGFLTPRTVGLESAAELIERVGFPLVTKARWGQGSAGLAIIEGREQLGRLPATAVLQPYLRGPEYNLDILRDPRAGVVAVVPKLKVAMYDGTTQLARTVDRPDLVALGVALGEAVGHIGGIDVDLVLSDQGWFIIDVNPRIGGGLPTTAAACPAYVDALLAICAGVPVEPFLGGYRRAVEVRRDVYYYVHPASPGDTIAPWNIP